MGKQIKVVLTRHFSKSIKKLKANQKADLDTAIHAIIADPLIGEQKMEIYLIYAFTNSPWSIN